MKRIALFATVLAFFSSCDKDDASTYNSNIKGDVSVEFDNIVGAADLQLNTGQYSNSGGQTFNVTKFKYYVSNFVLTNTNGTEYTVPQDSSYFLVDESDESTHAPVLHVPEGEYKSIQFIIGVDSLRNTMDVSQRTGDLDIAGPGSDMYWAWNSGYVFFKFEGTSSASTFPGNLIQYHIGGFGGYNTPTVNNIKTIKLDLTTRGAPQVKSGKETNVHLMVDILKALDGKTKFDFATTPMVHDPNSGIPMANNFDDMIKHDHTEN